MEPGNRADEQVTSGGDIRENQHDEREWETSTLATEVPEAAGEEHSEKLRKTTRFEQEAPSSSAAASDDPTVALEYHSSGET